MRPASVLSAGVLIVVGLVCYAMIRESLALPPEDESVDTLPVLRREVVKWALDDAADKIDRRPQTATIAALLALPRPADLRSDDSSPRYQDKRIAPLETTIWRLEATLTSIVLREDGDLYLVLVDGRGGIMVGEAPNVEECKGSVFRDSIAAVWDQLVERFQPTQRPRPLDLRVTIEGIGFFGRSTDREGAHHSGARLMPITRIQFH
ncbi:MAG: hypothetical protein H6534_04100 [Chthonomonadaceae bacterium]|nr:hypothetical protein [Chthonomonadaceae bacterium]